MAHGVSNGHMTDDVSGVNRDLGVFWREIGSLEKIHGIGQTPCSYEHYLVSKNSFTCSCCVCKRLGDWDKNDAQNVKRSR